MPTPCQPAILRPIPQNGRFLTFALRDRADPTPALRRLSRARHDPKIVLGLGAPLVGRIGAGIDGLRPFPWDLGLFPSTQSAVWAFLSHADRGVSFDAERELGAVLGHSFLVVEEIEAFTYRKGRDLTGFEDGTENPRGRAAERAALVRGRGPGLDGGSFVAVQRWVHDLGAMARMSLDAREAVIGRRLHGNHEIAAAPASAHVKRTAQESFDPPAFVLRRSMPYGGVSEHGLYFVAYGESPDRFERILRRMAGRDDGIVDGLLALSRAVTGGYYFCPPVVRGKLDLRAVGF